MTKHILDKTRAGADSRLAHFMRIDKDTSPRPQTKELQRRASDRAAMARTRAFMRIERAG